MKKKYIRVAVLALVLITIIIAFNFDKDQTIINGAKHFLKAVLRVL